MKSKDILKTILLDIVNPKILRRKRKKKYHIPKGINGINIGCGIHNPDNWIGIDGGFSHYIINIAPKFVYKIFFNSQHYSDNHSFEDYYSLAKNAKVVHHDILYGLPFPDESVPNIFSSHFFEHIFKKDAESLMKECYRVMKPDGLIRICVPSLADEVNTIGNAIASYKANESDEIQKYVTSNSIGHSNMYSNHRYMYDWDRLSRMLKKAGFRDVRKCEFKKGKIKDVEILDTRTGLIVEAAR